MDHETDGTSTGAAAPAGTSPQAGGALTAKGSRTRARIVGAAADLMYERGPGATTLGQIRADAGVSSSQVYHYFADKQTLVRAVVDHQAERVVAALAAADLSTLAGWRTWLGGVLDAERRRQQRGGPSSGLVVGDLGSSEEQGRTEAAAGLARWAEVAAQGLADLRAAGTLPPDVDPQTLATAVLASIEGALMLARVQRDLAPLRATSQSVVRLLELLADAPRP